MFRMDESHKYYVELRKKQNQMQIQENTYNMKVLAKLIRVQLLAINSMGCSPPGSSISLGFFQARILKWVAVSFSKGSSQPRDQIQVSCLGRLFTAWATREATYCMISFIKLRS